MKRVLSSEEGVDPPPASPPPALKVAGQESFLADGDLRQML